MSFESKFPRRVVQSEMCGLEPNLIADFPWVEVACSPGSHELMSGVMSGQGFFSGFVELGESLPKSREEGLP